MNPNVTIERPQSSPGTALAPQQSRTNELAPTAAAAHAKAMVEAAYAIAQHRHRNVMQARTQILEACQRPEFAKAAIYSKPVGGKTMQGPSIRMAEELVRSFGNIHISKTTIYEDHEKRAISVTVTDLENNLSYSGEIVLGKSVERKNVKPGTVVLGTRVNTYGERVNIVEATEDELAVKEAAQVSKMIRTSGLRLIPADIVDDAMAEARRTMAKEDAVDPKAASKKMFDSFAGIGVTPDMIAALLKHNRPQFDTAELARLRGMYSAIKAGEASWQDYVDGQQEGESPTAGKVAEAAAKAKAAQQAKTESPAVQQAASELVEEIEEATERVAQGETAPAAQPAQRARARAGSLM